MPWPTRVSEYAKSYGFEASALRLVAMDGLVDCVLPPYLLIDTRHTCQFGIYGRAHRVSRGFVLFNSES